MAFGAVIALGAASCDQATEDAPAAAPQTPAPAEAEAAPREAALQVQAPVAEPDSCVTYDPSYQAAPLMRVRGGAGDRLRMQDRAEACPASGACPWRREGYVIGSDVVLASAPVNGFRCVYVGAASTGEILAGFLPADGLEPVEEAGPVTPEFLAGTWSADDYSRIVFRQEGGRTLASGSATYGEGASTNMGEFEGELALDGPRFSYGDEEGCEVTGVRRGPYLVVRDNNQCGGLNVTFNGIYVRTGP
jgi:hypothetical protein